VALFAAGTMVGSRQPVTVPRFVVPGAVGGMGPQEWPVVVTGRVKVCLLPSSVRSLTLVLSFYVHGSKRGVGLHRIHVLAQWQNEASLLGVGRGIARSQGVRRAKPVPQGSGMPNLCL
jgi:hypothetical protein